MLNIASPLVVRLLTLLKPPVLHNGWPSSLQGVDADVYFEAAFSMKSVASTVDFTVATTGWNS
jgi:hypothetical protein